MLKTKPHQLQRSLSNAKAPATKQPQEQQIDIEQILKNNTNQINKYEYECFLILIKQNQLNTAFTQNLLQSLNKCIYLLEPQLYENFINTLIHDVKWQQYSKHSHILDLLSEFLVNLCSAYANYLHKCLHFLIKIFSITNIDTTTIVGVEASIDCEAMYGFAHKCILSFLKISPGSCKTHIVKLADSLYPYMIKDTQIQNAYMGNLLRLIDSIPDVRLSVLEICVQKMLKIDVNAPRDQILNAEIDAREVADLADKTETNENDGNKTMKNPFADRLDVMMGAFFKYIHTKSIDPTTNKLNWDECKSIYKDLLFTFDRYILRTYGSSHVQFLMFYICSYKLTLSEAYLDYLWKKFSNPSTCPIIRQLCAYYIGSYISRAKYLNINSIIASLQLMIKWLHNYLDTIDSCKLYPNLDVHRTFYSLCQTVFYIIVFRHFDLFSSNDYIDKIKSWKLSSIIQSKLNPLRFCLPTITQKFASITRLYQVVYCYGIIDANNRLTLPILSHNHNGLLNKKFFSNLNNVFSQSDTTAVSKETLTSTNNVYEDNPLDSFFPFDPYLLKRSKFYIDKNYEEFKDFSHDAAATTRHDDEDCEMDSDETSLDEDDEDEDDDEDDDDSGDGIVAVKNSAMRNPWSDDDDDN